MCKTISIIIFFKEKGNGFPVNNSVKYSLLSIDNSKVINNRLRRIYFLYNDIHFILKIHIG